MIEATELYSNKHYDRADKNLKRVYYVNYVLSQMTLQDDVDRMTQKKSIPEEKQPTKSSPSAVKTKVRKRDKKLKDKR